MEIELPSVEQLQSEIERLDNFNKVQEELLKSQKENIAKELLSGVGDQMKQDIYKLNNNKKKKDGFFKRLINIFS